MPFPEFHQVHDPDGRIDYTWRFQLNAGEEISSAVVEVVDETSSTVDESTDIVIEMVTIGVISGNLWGVTAWISGGGAQATYYLRCRGETDSAPLSRKFNRTVMLHCAQQ